MMDQNKQGSFNWWWLIGAIFVYGVLVSLWNGAENADVRAAIQETQQSDEILWVDDAEQFQAVVADGDHDSNVCRFATNELFTEEVTILYPDYNPADKVAGRWNPASNTIELMQPNGLSVQTVAHEVSHMVDTFMAQQPNIDPHYEAYMQGFWTWCVYEIMQHDIRCAQDPWCSIR